MDIVRLTELIRIRFSFTRSANIEQDLLRWLNNGDSFILSPLFGQVSRRIMEGILSSDGNRAWTILGPYGTGKSTSILALASCLSGAPESQIVRELQKNDPDLWSTIERVRSNVGTFLPLMLTGHRGPITPQIHRVITLALEHRVQEDASANELLKVAKAYAPNDDRAVAELLTHLSKITPVMLVLDELGKFIEFAIQHPQEGDLYTLQVLAEAAQRAETHPLVLLTVLHQAPERYGASLLQSQRQELVKVQGRFEEISFQQPTGQILRLIRAAIELDESSEDATRLLAEATDLSADAWRLGVAPTGMSETEFVGLVARCAPLHPLSALLLAPLFRRVAQSERSLFAFLSSGEPHGLQSFMAQHDSDNGPGHFYPADELYDYIVNACGTSLYVGQQGRRWAEVDAALRRVRDLAQTEARVIKLVGLMNAIGDLAVLRPSKEVLEYALGSPDLTDVLDSLAKKSVLVYRRFTGSYLLWEGSDLDIDERIEEASNDISEAMPLHELLSGLLDPQPEVARRHSYRTGSLRYFSVRHVTAENVLEEAIEPIAPADGRLLYVLTERVMDEKALAAVCEGLQEDQVRQVVIVPLRVSSLLKSAALELRRLKWVQHNTPELMHDDVARKEMAGRILEAEQVIRRELDSAMPLAEGTLLAWHASTVSRLTGRRDLNQLLSTVCDEVYSKSPIIRNELVNRQHLSSSATAARRLLLERMIMHQAEENLGISGFPPHMSMYLSALKVTGIHRKVSEDRWTFGSPDAGSPMAPVWDAWRAFLATTGSRRRPVTEFWQTLEQPPYGVKAGVTPILQCAMLLEHYLDVALYENGTFVPELDVPVMERMTKVPDKFEVRHCPLEGIRAEVFEALREVSLTGNAARDQLRILAAVKPLVQFIRQIPPYSANTKLISAAAQKVRYLLDTAREPDTLIFEQLPQALGLMPFAAQEGQSQSAAEQYARALKQAILEIRRAYQDLCDYIGATLADAMLVAGSLGQTRSVLKMRAQSLLDSVADMRLKGFAMRLAATDLDDVGWLEALGSFVVGKAPKTWSDEDRDRFGIELKQLSSRFMILEDLYPELQERYSLDDMGYAAGQIRLVTTRAVDRRSTFAISMAERHQVENLAQQLLGILNTAAPGENRAFKVAVVGALLENLTSRRKGKEEAASDSCEEGETNCPAR